MWMGFEWDSIDWFEFKIEVNVKDDLNGIW